MSYEVLPTKIGERGVRATTLDDARRWQESLKGPIVDAETREVVEAAL